MSGRAFDWSSFQPKDAATVDALRRRLVGNAPVVPIKGVTHPHCPDCGRSLSFMGTLCPAGCGPDATAAHR